MSEERIGRAAIESVESLIRPYIRETPIVRVEASDFGLSGSQITFKLELLQHAGSFKARGAFANLLGRDVPPAGVVAASGGNHGAAVAYAAGKLGIRARIFVPTVASEAKIQRIRDYGVELVVGGDRYADALAASEAWGNESGAMPIHAYDQRETLLGQGTVGRELELQAPDCDCCLVSVGGGGLIGGICAWFRESRRHVKLIGVEPEASPTLTRALEAGEPVDAPAEGIARDSLAPRRVGRLMFPIARAHLDRVLLVTDDEIRAAQNELWHSMRIAAEPGGAAAFAALLAGKYRAEGSERVSVLVCGGNTTSVSFEDGSSRRENR